MDLDMAKSVIQKAHDCGIERLGFHTVGEPLLYPHLCEVLVFAKKFGFPVGISANANLLTPKKTEMLMNIGIDSLRVSLEGTDSTYDFIRQGGNFLKVIDNIEYFRNRRNRNMYPKITCNYVLTKDSIKCVNDFMSNYAKLFDEVTFCTMINQGYMQNSYVQDRSIILFKNNNYPCFNLWNNMYVTFNGDVSVCCVDYNHKLIVGNVKTDTLLDIWNSKAYQRYRKLHKQGRINEMEFCRNCTMPVLGSSFQMSKVGELVRRRYGLNIKILNRY
jgi:radical SAM protein with 4Fe4S-binding SPASM domain